MKAAVYTRYGAPDVVRIDDVDSPVPVHDEVLVKIRAASVNPLDWHRVRGSPYLMRMLGGLRRPADRRLGVDAAGTVEAVDKNVTGFKPGDDVFGFCKGAFAEFACGPVSELAMKPRNVTFEQAAAVPVAAITALQGLRGKGRIEPGQKILINGAAGGVGTFAVQIAKAFGAEVTGVCSTQNMTMVRSIGADRVIDYTQEDFTRVAQRQDLLLDCVGNRSLFALRRSLSQKGALVVVTGPDGRWLGPLARFGSALILSGLVSQRMLPFITKPTQSDLCTIRELVESGKVTPVIDRRYGLGDAGAAIRYVEGGHARGKVIITTD